MLNRRKTNGILSSTAIATRKQGQDNQLSLWIMYKYAPCLQEFDLSSFENSLSYVKTFENQGSKNLKNQQNLHSSTAPLCCETPRGTWPSTGAPSEGPLRSATRSATTCTGLELSRSICVHLLHLFVHVFTMYKVYGWLLS